MKITFYGAAQDVTGSKHLVETNGTKILLDCGLHQGSRAESHAKNQTLPFDARSIDATILSHGHLDHCGMMPVLVSSGYAGKIYCTSATAEIAHLIMEDAASVQKQDYDFLERHHEIGSPEPLPPLYGKADVQAVTPHFAQAPYFRLQPSWVDISAEARFKFYDAGHILGSAITLLEVQEDGVTKRLAYTGDLGQFPVPILSHPEAITEPTDILLIESTYGDRVHKPNAEALNMLAKIIKSAADHGRTVIMPAFALGRVQEIIYMLHQVYDRPETPRIPVYVDSPLAERLIPIFEKHVEDYNKEVKTDFSAKREMPFEFPELTYLRTPEDSKTLNDKSGPMIILGSSGMMEGGRILHHLVRRIEDHTAMIVITGYQAEGTLGRKIQSGISPVRVLGRMFQVNAEVLTIDEFSAHADRNGLLDYVKSVPGLKQVCLVHGEAQSALSFKALLNQELPHLIVTVPAPGDSVNL